MKASIRNLAAVTAFAFLAIPAFAQKFPPDVQDALNLVRKHIEALPNGKAPGEFAPLAAADVRQVFPDHRMVVVRYRLYPIAMIVPDGLNASNLFAVNKAGKIEFLKDVKALEAFFRKNHAAVKIDNDAKAVLTAWLTLTPEFHQDGFYKFEVLDKEFAVSTDRSKASGRTVVMQGGNGDIRVDLAFDGTGKLTKAMEKAAIRRGPRPICQATKLLDSDPIVRRIAEQDLLIMGVAARDYLMEQRDRATPDLREAIDRLWRQIRTNGW